MLDAELINMIFKNNTTISAVKFFQNLHMASYDLKGIHTGINLYY